MKLWTSRKKNPSTGDEAGEPSPVSAWSGSSALTTRAISWTIVAALAAGVVALVLVLSGYGQPAQSKVKALPDALSGQRAVVGDFGQRVVATWLRATIDQEAVVEELVAVSNVRLPRTNTLQVTDTSVADISVDAADGVWSVVVSAEIIEGNSLYRRYFTVPVQASPGQDGAPWALRAVALPAPAPAPILAQARDTDYPENVEDSYLLAQTVASFLSAYWTGQGEIDRLTTPDAQIAAVLPAPYSSLEVQDIFAHEEIPEQVTSAQSVQVLATVEVANGDPTKTATTVQVPLSVQSREGRWEISRVDPVPLMKVESKTSTPTPMQPTPSGSPS